MLPAGYQPTKLPAQPALPGRPCAEAAHRGAVPLSQQKGGGQVDRWNDGEDSECVLKLVMTNIWLNGGKMVAKWWLNGGQVVLKWWLNGD